MKGENRKVIAEDFMQGSAGKRLKSNWEHAEPKAAAVASPVPRMWVVVYVLVLLLPLLRCAAFAWHETSRQAEFAQAGDAFGYFQMAQDIRRGAAPHGLPRFTADSPHARL